jgi:hypothetical protein
MGRPLLLLAVVLGCPHSPPPAQAPSPARVSTPPVQPELVRAPATMPSGAEDPLVACEDDDDCELVELGCCDRCNGGWVMSFAKATATEARSRWREPGCGRMVHCTSLGCLDHARAVCDAGTCARIVSPFGPDGIAPTLLPNERPPWARE